MFSPEHIAGAELEPNRRNKGRDQRRSHQIPLEPSSINTGSSGHPIVLTYSSKSLRRRLWARFSTVKQAQEARSALELVCLDSPL
jgi:hypothetical protein